MFNEIFIEWLKEEIELSNIEVTEEQMEKIIKDIKFAGPSVELIGENPDLSEFDAKQIREQAGSRIYSGKNQAKCSICGHDIPAPDGVCAACPTCGSNFGSCG